MSNILALDTTTINCSVAFSSGDHLVQKLVAIPRQHNKQLLRLIHEVLAEADISLHKLDYIAVSVGPGSFTGVRLGLSVAQGLAMGLGIPIIPVSSLEVVAMAAFAVTDVSQVLVGFDARMSQIYWGGYSRSSEYIADAIASPATIKVAWQNYALVGEAWSVYKDQLQQLCYDKVLDIEPNPQAQYVALYARNNVHKAVAAHSCQPVYLRNEVAHKKCS